MICIPWSTIDIVSIQPAKRRSVDELGNSLIYDWERHQTREERGEEITQMHREVETPDLGLDLFAAVLLQVLPLVKAANRHDALDSSRLYSSSSALRIGATMRRDAFTCVKSCLSSP